MTSIAMSVLVRGLVRVLVFVATAYLAVLAVLFVFQARFLFPAPQERHDPPPGFEAITLSTSDGLDLTAHWRAPDADQGGEVSGDPVKPPINPTIVWFHGNGGSLAGSAYETRVVAEQGYGLLLVSYRGYGGNPGEPSEAGFYRDGRSAMDFLADQGVMPDQTIIAGNSIGSGTAVQMTSEYSPAGMILVAPFTSLIDAASDALPIFPVQFLLSDRFDNADKLASIDLPVLILHGTADDVVPFEHGQALAANNDWARFVVFEGAGHDLSFSQEAQVEQAEWLAGLGL